MVEMLADLTYHDPALGGRSLAQIQLPADEVYRRLLDAATARRPRSAEEAEEFDKAAASDPQRDVFQRAGSTATEITIAMERQAGVPDAEIAWVLGVNEDELASAGANDVGEFWRILAGLPAEQFEGYHRVIEQLTSRQREFWALLLQGLKTAEIARRIGVGQPRVAETRHYVVGRLTKAIGSTKAEALVDAAERGTAGELGRILGQLSPEQFQGYYRAVQQLTLGEREFLACRLLRLSGAEIARRIGVTQHELHRVEAAVIGQLTDAIGSAAAHTLVGVVVDSGAAAEFGRVLAEASDDQWELYRGVIRQLSPASRKFGHCTCWDSTTSNRSPDGVHGVSATR